MNLFIGFLRLLSWLPLRVLYVVADVCFPVVYYVARYRRAVVRSNMEHAFPELSERERRRMERGFYRFLCDYAAETLKLLTMSPAQMKRRMEIHGVEQVEQALEANPFVFVYLGHYCNWEWISSMPLWATRPEVRWAQLYRPLKSPAFDALFLRMRSRFGSENIAKYESLRHIMQMKRAGERAVIGFISDQSPNGNSIHDWVTFLHQDTPVFTGTERIAKKVNAAIFFADVQRLSRGHYRLVLRHVTSDVRSYPDYQITELYMQQLEQIIRRQPALWLWSHRRWKHSRTEPQA